MTTGAAIAGLVIAAGSAAYSANQQHEAANTQERQQAASLKAQQAALDKANQVPDQGALDRLKAQRELAATMGGRAGTILTSPLGLTGQGKTQLGQ